MSQYPCGHAFSKTKAKGSPQLGTLQKRYCAVTHTLPPFINIPLLLKEGWDILGVERRVCV